VRYSGLTLTLNLFDVPSMHTTRFLPVSDEPQPAQEYPEYVGIPGASALITTRLKRLVVASKTGEGRSPQTTASLDDHVYSVTSRRGPLATEPRAVSTNVMLT